MTTQIYDGRYVIEQYLYDEYMSKMRCQCTRAVYIGNRVDGVCVTKHRYVRQVIFTYDISI